jgi:endonuclease/exonuclease/phosphatase family metal-dependent hydrolase
MRVLTYNIAGSRTRRRPAYLEEIANLILKTDADVVGLQEVVHYPGTETPPEEMLARLTGMHATFVPAHQFKRHCLGNAVLCREPIQQTVSHHLPYAWPEQRILMEVDTTVRGLPLTVFCTHLVHGARIAARLRLAQATSVAHVMRGCGQPHLMMGDLNTSPHARELAPVRDACEVDGHLKGLSSWPSRRPWILYDHIWPGPGWELEEVRILDPHLSDHRPLLAQLAWKGSPRFAVHRMAGERAPGP